MKQQSVATFLALFSPFAHAHPGEHHGKVFDAVAHLLSEPDHLAMALVAVAVGLAGARFYRRAASRSGNAGR